LTAFDCVALRRRAAMGKKARAEAGRSGAGGAQRGAGSAGRAVPRERARRPRGAHRTFTREQAATGAGKAKKAAAGFDTGADALGVFGLKVGVMEPGARACAPPSRRCLPHRASRPPPTRAAAPRLGPGQ
jgi:hypothetical protein